MSPIWESDGNFGSLGGGLSAEIELDQEGIKGLADAPKVIIPSLGDGKVPILRRVTIARVGGRVFSIGSGQAALIFSNVTNGLIRPPSPPGWADNSPGIIGYWDRNVLFSRESYIYSFSARNQDVPRNTPLVLGVERAAPAAGIIVGSFKIIVDYSVGKV